MTDSAAPIGFTAFCIRFNEEEDVLTRIVRLRVTFGRSVVDPFKP